MVLVSVGDKEALYPIDILNDIAKIGDNNVDSGQIVIGECHSTIDDYYIVTAFVKGDILSNFFESTERNDADRLGNLILCLTTRLFGSG